MRKRLENVFNLLKRGKAEKAGNKQERNVRPGWVKKCEQEVDQLLTGYHKENIAFHALKKS
jgi:hypothetical protein